MSDWCINKTIDPRSERPYKVAFIIIAAFTLKSFSLTLSLSLPAFRSESRLHSHAKAISELAASHREQSSFYKQGQASCFDGLEERMPEILGEVVVN